jgi:hypothetical protein
MMDVLDYLPAVPAGLVLVGGVVYLLATRRRSRRAFALALVGVVWLLALHLYDVLLAQTVIQRLLDLRAGGGPLAVGTTLKMYATVYALLYAVGIALLIFAVMTDRRTPAPNDGE